MPIVARGGSANLEQLAEAIWPQEKPLVEATYVNGGYMVCNYALFDYLSDDPQIMFEQEPIAKLLNNNQLHSFRHEGFWQPMDTLRDKMHLQALWDSGKAPWKI